MHKDTFFIFISLQSPVFSLQSSVNQSINQSVNQYSVISQIADLRLSLPTADCYSLIKENNPENPAGSKFFPKNT